MSNARHDPPAEPGRTRPAGLRRTAARVAAPVVWLLAGAGLLLVAGDPERPWVSGWGGPAANPPVFAWLSFSPGAPLTRTLREDGLRVVFAGPPRALAADEERPGFAPPPDELWPPGWGVDGFAYDPWAPGAAQRAASLRFSGWFLAAFVPAFAAVWWAAAFVLRKRREGRGERIEPDRRPGWFGLLRGVLKPWVLLAAVAGAAEVSGPLTVLAECAGAGRAPVGGGIDPPWHFGEPGELDGEPRGLIAGVFREESAAAPPAGAGRRAAAPGFRVLSSRTFGRGGWRVGAAESRNVERTGRTWRGRMIFVGPWWAVAVGILSSLLAARRWRTGRRNRAEVPAPPDAAGGGAAAVAPPPLSPFRGEGPGVRGRSGR